MGSGKDGVGRLKRTVSAVILGSAIGAVGVFAPLPGFDGVALPGAALAEAHGGGQGSGGQGSGGQGSGGQGSGGQGSGGGGGHQDGEDSHEGGRGSGGSGGHEDGDDHDHEDGGDSHEGGQGSGGRGSGGSGGHEDGDDHDHEDGGDSHEGGQGSGGQGNRDDHGEGRGDLGQGQGSGSSGGQQGGGSQRPPWAGEGIPEIELGRLNVARSPDHVLDRAYAEALAQLGAMAGFYNLPLDQMLVQLSSNWDAVALIDSPLQNLALFRDALDGQIDLTAYGISNDRDTLMAVFVGVASDKTIPVTAETVFALSVILEIPLSMDESSAIAAEAEAIRQAVLLGHG